MSSSVKYEDAHLAEGLVVSGLSGVPSGE
jgi:hypothetical protein